jgi:hypothetical protein
MNSDFILGLMPVMGVDGFDDIVGVILFSWPLATLLLVVSL